MAQEPDPADPLDLLAIEVDASDDPFGLVGDEAVAALESTASLDVVAAAADLQPAELVEELTTDPAMFVGVDGSVGYVDRLAPGQLSAPVDEPAEFTVPAGANVFALESLPGGRKVLYLDFDGHVTSGDPYWNNVTPGPGTSAPYAGSTAQIYEIWRRVAEDYAPFGVNVTTRDPGVEGLRKTSSGDDAYGQRMVVSPTNWTGSPATLGIALVNVFSSSGDRPGFVFTSSLSTANVAEAISHEAGHTFGLSHDGRGSDEYYTGHGLWAPIMGSPLSKAVTQWSRGEYPNATNREDDVARIASNVGYRSDDVRPGAVVGLPINATRTGLLGFGDDDTFVVDSAGGRLAATLEPLIGPSGSNLLADLTICDASGALVAKASGSPPFDRIDAAISANPGRYTIVVRSIGWQTPGTGFSAYGSAGEYRLTTSGTQGSASATAGCASELFPIAPDRLLDTRVGLGGSRRLPAGTEAVVQVAGSRGVPADASAAIVNVTAVTPSGWGYLTVHPCQPIRPETSNINYVAGQVVANTTIAALSPNGQLCVWTSAEADVLVDVTGWLGPGSGSKLSAVGPERVVDTRSNIGGVRLGAGQTLTVDLAGRVPADATAAAFNLTAVGGSNGGYLTAYPCGQARPNTSVVNHTAVEARPNNVIVGLTNRRFCIYSYAASDVIVDLTGYFAPSGALSYVPTAPQRVLDTREGRIQPPRPANSVLPYAVTGGLPAGVDPDAAFVNVTSVDHPQEGYVTTYDCADLPYTSTVNQRLGQANANGAIVPLDPSSRSCGYLSAPAHLLVDLNGWWVR